MHIWTIRKWEKLINTQDSNLRKGLHIRFDKKVDPEVRRACKEFCAWIRKNYCIPKRVVIYFKDKEFIRSQDGEFVSATFLGPFDYSVEPYIRIATGDYQKLYAKFGKDNALSSILGSISHELTHYFQWINGLILIPRGAERQARAYVDYILDEYQETHEHP